MVRRLEGPKALLPPTVATMAAPHKLRKTSLTTVDWRECMADFDTLAGRSVSISAIVAQATSLGGSPAGSAISFHWLRRSPAQNAQIWRRSISL